MAMNQGTPTTSEQIYRARRVGMTFGRIYLGIKTQQFIARRLRPQDMPRRWARFNRSSARSIYDAAIDLRGLILKGCQFLGSRADVLPREYVDVLAKLQDRVPPKPFPVVRRTVEAELERPLHAIFESFSPNPIASASLAQVHEARLRGGERVAVKVQYPEIAALVRGDLASLRFLFRAVGYVERDLDLMPLIDELASTVPRELDFMNEGRNAETVARQLAHRPDIRVPRIHWEHTSRRVLVMEYMDGIKINDLRALKEAAVDVNSVARTVLEAYCEQILANGFFHADPHPGNLLVQADGPGAPRVVLLDFGLSKELPPRFREGVVTFAGATLRGDPEAMAAALVDLGFETRDGTSDSLAAVARIFVDVSERFRTRSHVDRKTAERLGREITEAIRENPVVRMPGHIVLLGRVLGLLSGLNRSLDARVDLVSTVLPYALGHSNAPGR